LLHFVLAEKSGLKYPKSDLQTLIIPDLELNIFEAIDALTQKNKSKAIRLLKEHLWAGRGAVFIFYDSLANKKYHYCQNRKW